MDNVENDGNRFERYFRRDMNSAGDRDSGFWHVHSYRCSDRWQRCLNQEVKPWHGEVAETNMANKKHR